MHIGHNVTRLRSYRGIAQKEMAQRLRMPADTYAQLEGEPVIADDVLKRIATELDYEPDFIKWMPETGAPIFNSGSHIGSVGYSFHCTFNPIEKITELYERLLRSEQEKNILLQQQLNVKS